MATAVAAGDSAVTAIAQGTVAKPTTVQVSQQESWFPAPGSARSGTADELVAAARVAAIWRRADPLSHVDFAASTAADNVLAKLTQSIQGAVGNHAFAVADAVAVVAAG